MSSIVHQNRVTPSPFNFGLWTLDLDLDLDCDNKTLWLTLWIISWNGKFYPSLSWPITGKIQRRCQKPIWARSPKKLFSQWMIKRRVKEKIAFYMEVKMIKKNKNCIFYHQVLTIAFTESFWLLNNVLLHCWESSTTTFDFIK